MSYCSECGAGVRSTTKFCEKCGTANTTFGVPSFVATPEKKSIAFKVIMQVMTSMLGLFLMCGGCIAYLKTCHF